MPRATIEDATRNLESSLATIPGRYEMGVQNADWKAGVDSPQANENWKMGIQNAVNNDYWKKGIGNVSNESWKQAAMTKGKNSIAEGIRQSLPKYQANFTPILAAMNDQAARLPPRTTDFRQNVSNRVIPVIEAARRAAGRSV